MDSVGISSVRLSAPSTTSQHQIGNPFPWAPAVWCQHQASSAPINWPAGGRTDADTQSRDLTRSRPWARSDRPTNKPQGNDPYRPQCVRKSKPVRRSCYPPRSLVYLVRLERRRRCEPHRKEHPCGEQCHPTPVPKHFCFGHHWCSCQQKPALQETLGCQPRRDRHTDQPW